MILLKNHVIYIDKNIYIYLNVQTPWLVKIMSFLLMKEMKYFLLVIMFILFAFKKHK